MFADVREDRVQFATMTREALTSMLRRTYESAIAPPDAPPDSAAMRAYNDRYLSWKKDPELQFNETLDRKGTR